MTVGESASVQRSTTTPGMPRYRVVGSAKGDREFPTYADARRFKAEHGGKMRAV